MITSSNPAHLATERGACVTIGNFDGVHSGHLSLLSATCDKAREHNLSPIAVTFWPHPRAILEPGFVAAPLTDIEERRKLLKQAGMEGLLELNFTRQLANLSAEEFIRKCLEPLNMRHLVVGHDFRMGHNSSRDELEAIASRIGFGLTRIGALTHGDSPVSSTRIRELVRKGDVAKAAELLGRPYSIHGIVEHGLARGRDLGFPTANLGMVQGCVPGDGVYAAWASFNDLMLPAVTNIGANPTFGAAERTIESFLLQPAGDLYGLDLTLFFVEKLRGERKFPSPTALIEQIARDVTRAREILVTPPDVKG